MYNVINDIYDRVFQNMEKKMIKFSLVKPLLHNSFDPNALKVYRRLREYHHKVYFVGGCIRDLLLGRTPKDFDIATSATPQQICKIFRNARIIGRRFLIVSIFFGRKVVEVTTFRRSPWKDGTPDSEQSKDLLLLSDNVFGTDEEDALRRDFTINALFYDIQERTVIDYVEGLKDLQMGKIRLIGDPDLRFAEDPVRILRALKLQATLHFDIVPETQQALEKNIAKLSRAAPARLLLEMEKILRGGASYDCFERLASANIFSIIAPDIHRIWHQSKNAGQMLKSMLHGLDSLSQKKRNSLKESVLLASLCLPVVHLYKLPGIVGDEFCKQKLSRLASNISISKKLVERISHLIQIQWLLEKPRFMGHKNKKFLHSSLLPDALEILKMQAQNDAKKQEIYQFWQQTLAHELGLKASQP